jgi:transcriptional regulator with XRE-family HTH domain
MMHIYADTKSLRDTRIKAGYSIRQLAAMCKLSLGTYYQVECGYRPARPSTAAKICDALGIDFDSVFTIMEVSHGEQ